MIKKIIAFAVLSGALAFAVLLIIGKGYNPHSVKTEKPPKLGFASDFISPKNFNADDKNSTDELVKKISKEIVSNKPTLANLPNPEELVNQYISEGVKNFDYQALKPSVKITDLKVVNNSGPQFAKEYLASLKQIINDNFANASITLDDPNSANWDILQKLYDKTVAELYNLPVPQNLTSFHQKEISLLSAQKKIFEYIRNYKNDPLRAWLAVSASQKLDQEFLVLAKEINENARRNL